MFKLWLRDNKSFNKSVEFKNGEISRGNLEKKIYFTTGDIPSNVRKERVLRPWSSSAAKFIRTDFKELFPPNAVGFMTLVEHFGEENSGEENALPTKINLWKPKLSIGMEEWCSSSRFFLIVQVSPLCYV